jgi:muramoyltetrapeptide carboxypeptidase
MALEGPDLEVQGTLWGGNLALVAHLVGSPYLPPVKDGVLFLEDIGESPYRIERLLLQLHFCGVLGAQRAIVLGSFNGYEPGPNDGGHDLAAVVAQLRSRIDVPVYTGLPFGHVRDKLTLPVGGQARLVVRDGRAQLALSGYA